MIIKKIVSVALLLLVPLPSYSFFNFPYFEPEKSGAFSFLSSTESKKNELKKIEESLTSLKQQESERTKTIENQINALNKAIETAKKRLPFVRTEAEQEYLHKKITSLNERKQNLTLAEDIVQETARLLEKKAKIIKESLDFEDAIKNKTFKAYYQWQELCETQTKTAEINSKIDFERKKKNDLVKQKTAELETMTSLQKRIEVKNKEQKKSLTVTQINTEKLLQDRDFALNNNLHNDLLDEEIGALKEQVFYSELVIKKIEADIALKDSEIEFLEQTLTTQKNELLVIEKRLTLSLNDVEVAKAEVAIENQKTARTKDLITKKIDHKKIEKERLVIERNLLQKNLRELEASKKYDAITYHTLQSELHKANNYYLLLDREIDLLFAKNNLAKVPVQNKELLFAMVNLRYKLNNQAEDINELIVTYKNQKELVANDLKRLHDKRNEVLASIVEISREIEDTKIREIKILQRRDSIFGHEEDAILKISANLDSIKRFLAERLVFSQEYLAINEELVSSEEKIIGSYDLILNLLEGKKSSNGLWRRSPAAISLKDLSASLIEAENFAKEVFWDTTLYLGPSIFFFKFKENFFFNILMLLLSIFFYLCFFILIKYGMQQIGRAIRKRPLSKNDTHPALFSILGASLLEFCLEHRKLILAWLFIYLHILAKFSWIFATMRPIGNRYSIALFYISSIPIFLYLSTLLLSKLKDLNKKLSFMFFAEKLQDRFLLLVSCVCYSSAVFLPLRAAFLIYHTQHESVLANVLMAAYSLILIMVLLLFFSKDDVQRLIPSRPQFFSFLKKQIDQHYYPVFLFIMGLLILSNPYVGYSNLAWFLTFVGPISVAILYTSIAIHYYIRKYAVFIFMKEDDEEMAGKFDYAKTYYGFFVIVTFVALLFGAFIIIARMWGFNYTPTDIWHLINQKWVLRLGEHRYLGFVQLFTVVFFIIGGFLTSSLLYRFVLNKIFDILRVEPGSQNTISKIFHYVIVSLSVVLGFIAIEFEALLWYIGTLLAVGLGLALKDILADYVSGFFILIERPIEIGNYVRLDDNPELQGTVHKIDARTTTIMNKLNHSLIISNKDILAKTIANWGKGRFAVGFEVHVTVDYRSNVDEVRKTLQEVIQNNPVILRVPNIIIRLEDFEANALHFLCRAFISSRRVQEQWIIASQIREDIFKAFNAKNIIFGFPQTVLHVEQFDKKRNAVTITFDQ